MHRQTPLPAILSLTFLASLASGVMWNGLGFITEETYGFSEHRNLFLHGAVGVVYVIAAFGSGALTRRIERRVSARSLLMAVLGAMGACSLGLLLPAGEWIIWTVAIVNSMLSALLWPVVEAFLASGRQGPRLRNAMGWWNLSWTSATGVALSMMAMLPEKKYAIVALAPLCAIAALLTRAFPRVPSAHEPDIGESHVGANYPALLRSARVLLPASYVLIATISPLMVYLVHRVEGSQRLDTVIGATWMFARVAAIAIMWRSRFWHGRAATLMLAGGATIGGFVATILATSVPMLIAGLIAFGAGQGILYYAALYYAMSVGRAEVDAGGTHEALIGVGYAIGPFAALAGSSIAGPAGIVVAIAMLLAAAAPMAVAPLLRREAGS